MITQKINHNFILVATTILLITTEIITGCNSPRQHQTLSNQFANKITTPFAQHTKITQNNTTMLGQHYVTAVAANQNNKLQPHQQTNTIYRYENYPQNQNIKKQNQSQNITQTSYADINPTIIKQLSGNNETKQQNTEPPQTNTSKTAPPKINLKNLINKSQQLNTQNTTKPNIQNSPYPPNTKNITQTGIRQEFIREITPLNNRNWTPNHSVLQTAKFDKNLVTINNVRYSKYNSTNNYQTRYYNATFDLNQIRTIDLIVVPLKGLPSIAHIESSFGFADGKHILMSITARYEEGEMFDPIASALRQFELIYVFADERDILQLDSQINKNEVYLYRLNFTPDEVRTMFVDALQRANKLAQKPEFYHPIRNSCVTNLIDHINKGRPKAIPSSYKTLLPGMIGKYVFDLKLIDTNETNFKIVKDNAKINWLVERFGDLEYFSAGIRNKTY